MTIHVFFGAKAGVGTTTVATTFAHQVSLTGAVTTLVDLDADCLRAIGHPLFEDDSSLIVGDPTIEDINSYCIELQPKLHVLNISTTPAKLVSPGMLRLWTAQTEMTEVVVFDLGQLTAAKWAAWSWLWHPSRSAHTWLVTDNSYAAMSKAVNDLPDGASSQCRVLVEDTIRPLKRDDVAQALGTSITVHFTRTGAVARACDAGLLTARVPVELEFPFTRDHRRPRLEVVK